MKKLLAGLMTVALLVVLVGCGGTSGGSASTSVDLSGYPEKFEDWTTKDVMKYFEDKGVFTDAAEQYIQVKNDEINPTPDNITEVGSYMDDEGLICSIIEYFDPNTDSDLVKEAYESTKANKKTGWIYEGETPVEMPVNHMIGQFAFVEQSVDQEHAAKFEAAIKDLAKDVNVEMDY